MQVERIGSLVSKIRWPLLVTSLPSIRITGFIADIPAIGMLLLTIQDILACSLKVTQDGLNLALCIRSSCLFVLNL